MKLRHCPENDCSSLDSKENSRNIAAVPKTPTKSKPTSPSRKKITSPTFNHPLTKPAFDLNLPQTPSKQILTAIDTFTPTKHLLPIADTFTPTKRILSLDLKTPKKASPFSATKALFYRSAKPSKLVARDNEKQLLQKFFLEKIKRQRPASMYISGNPGTGKSALVDEMLDEYCAEFKENDIFVVKINCMSIKDVQKIYSEILVELPCIGLTVSDGLNSSSTYELIMKSIQKGYLLLVLDEVDFLASTSDNDLLYGIFDWTVQSCSRIGIVAIANSLNFTDKTLPRLMAKNVEPELVHFSAYSISQITQIIKARLQECIGVGTVISDSAIELISRKVAACGDLRKALDTVKHSISLAERESATVTLKHVMKSLENATAGNNGKSSIISEMSIDSKVLLFCCNASKGNFMLKHALFQQYNHLATQYSWISAFSRSEFDDVLTQLEAKGLFLLSKPQKDGSIKVSCQFTTQELTLATQNCTLLKTINLSEV